MFTHTCPHCSKTRLLSTRHIKSMHRSLEGTVAYVSCVCGKTGVTVFPRPSNRDALQLIPGLVDTGPEVAVGPPAARFTAGDDAAA